MKYKNNRLGLLSFFPLSTHAFGMLALLRSLKPLQKGGTLGNSADLKNTGRLQFPSPSPILQSLQSRSCGAYVRGKKGQKPLTEYTSFVGMLRDKDCSCRFL
jgi:hypothetical protein